jgi:DNA ligase-1
MRQWSEVAEGIAATRATSRKVQEVAEYLRTLSPDELPIAVVFLAGRPFPERDPRTPGLGWAAIARVAEEVAGPTGGGIGAAYDRSSDLGTAVGDVLERAGHQPAGFPPTLSEVADAFGQIAETRGAAAKAALFKALIERSDPLTARYIAKVLSGESRIGLREGHLEAAIAAAFDRDLAQVQWAGMLTGDVGRTAELARDDRLGDAALELFHPLKSMLASPVADEAEALARMSPPVWVEDKYDGIRAQLHKLGTKVRLYSRDLHDVSGQFPEIGRQAAPLPWDGMLDGEILAWRDGVALPFLQLQARLGRKAPSAEIQESVPCIFVAFDLLAEGRDDGHVEPLLRLPLRERRARLEALGLDLTPGFGLAALATVTDEATLTEVFAGSHQRGNEGLMLKDPDSIYQPGRRGYAWLKLKKALTTLDCLVVGVEVGHGKRHGVLSDYTFAVADDRPGAQPGAVVTIGKAYSGLTDAEIATMTRWFEEHTIRELGRYRVVEPRIVVEIAFDVIHRSTRHASGYAMRFPRIVRIREDKTPGEIDKLSTVEAIHDSLQQGGRYSVLTSER